MLKDKLTGKFSAGLSDAELHRIPDTAPSQGLATINYHDEIKWTKLHNALRVEFVRHVGFEPEGIFTITVSYYVDHELKEPDSLYDIPSDVMSKELCSDLAYYLQESQGFPARVSQIIANLSAAFGGNPIILPPTLPAESSLH